MSARARIGTVKRFDHRQPVALARCVNCRAELYRFTWEGGETGWLHMDDQRECEGEDTVQGAMDFDAALVKLCADAVFGCDNLTEADELWCAEHRLQHVETS